MTNPMWLLRPVFLLVFLGAGTVFPQGLITTVAGGGPAGVLLNSFPLSGNPLGTIGGLTFDNAGNMYGTDLYHGQVFKVSTSGILTVIGGSGIPGTSSGDGGPATAATFDLAGPVAVDSVGNVYVVDINRVRKIDTSGKVTAFAGNGAYSGFSGDGGPAVAAEFSVQIGSVIVDSSNNVYIADTFNNRIRRVTADGNIDTVYGNGSYTAVSGSAAISSGVPLPNLMTFDSQGNLYFSEGDNQPQIYEISSGGIIVLFAGAYGGYFGDGGLAIKAGIEASSGLAVDKSGNVYLTNNGDYKVRVISGGIINALPGIPATVLAADASGNVYLVMNGVIRKRDSSGNVTIIGGTGSPTLAGDGGQAVDALLGTPQAVTLDSSGNLLIADTANKRIASVGANGAITTVAGAPQGGTIASTGPATSIAIGPPTGIVADSSNFYFDDGAIRKVNNSGTLTTLVGDSSSVALGIALDPQGDLYYTYEGFYVDKVLPNGSQTGLAGTTSYTIGGNYGDGGPATQAYLQQAIAVTSDSLGQIYIAEFSGNKIRKVNTSGIISTVAGNGTGGFSGDGGLATQAQLNSPSGVSVDTAGNLYIADTYNNRIRRVSPSGIISTVAGTGAKAFSGEGGPAFAASLNAPAGVYADNNNNLYIADTGNSRIRKISGIISDGAVLLSGAQGAPGEPAQVGVKLSLTTPGQNQVDNLRLTLAVAPVTPAPALAGVLSFQQAASLPAPAVFAAGNSSITVSWSNLATPLQDGANLGTLILSIPSSAAAGQVYNVQVTSTAASLGTSAVPLAAGAATVTIALDYLEGDSMPAKTDLNGDGSTNDAEEFGDNLLNTLDLMQLFRAVTGIPGFTPPVCSDRFDAMDVFPADTSSTRGGDGCLDNLDLLTLLNRVNGTDTAAPRRFARNLYCPAPAAQAQARHRTMTPPPQAAIELGASELRGRTRRMAVFLVTDGPQDLLTLSFSVRLDPDTPLSFVPGFEPGSAPRPTLADSSLPGFLAEAWLEGLSVAPTGRLLLGYLEWTTDETGAAETRVPRILEASAHLRDHEQRMYVVLPKGAAR